MKIFTSATIISLLASSAVEGSGIGDRLDRVFTKYIGQPLTSSEAVSDGFTLNNNEECDSVMGYTYSKNYERRLLNIDNVTLPINLNASEDTPTNLYFSAGGQLTGFSTDIYGGVATEPLKEGFFDIIDNGSHHRITISTRSNTKNVCDPDYQFEEPVGDAVIVQPKTIGRNIPLTRQAAEKENYHRGSCFDGMGFHYFKDLSSTDSSMSWKADNLQPVVVMYNIDDEINAVFFASSINQNGLFSTHEWEPVPLPDKAMCLNTCDDDCTFEGTKLWSTMHWYFNDNKQIKCVDQWGDLKCTVPGLGCCEKN